MELDTSHMTEVGALQDAEEIELAAMATNYIGSFRWCVEIKEAFLAFDIGKPLGVFLIRIEPKLVGVDELFWVIVGDCPPAYLVCAEAKDWVGALEAYVFEMRRWVDAVRNGEDLKKIIPVKASPTLEHADMLASRLDFIQRHLIDEKPF